MSKRKNKSHLTKTDINTICEMQRKIDAYESYIIGLSGLVGRDDRKDYIVVMQGTPMDDLVNIMDRKIKELNKELNEYRVKDIEKNMLKTCK